MIESVNNIIFWIGYLFIFSILLLGAIYALYSCVETIVRFKWFFNSVYNKVFDEKIIGLSEEEIDKWLKQQKDKWEKVNND